MVLRLDIQVVQLLHSCGIFENLRNLRTSRDELQDVSVILQRPALMLGSMAHLQGVLQDGDELFDLIVVQDTSGYPPLRSQAFQQVGPLCPLAVRWAPYLTFVGFERNRKLVLGNEIEGTFGQNLMNGGQNLILLLDIKVGRKVE